MPLDVPAILRRWPRTSAAQLAEQDRVRARASLIRQYDPAAAHDRLAREVAAGELVRASRLRSDYRLDGVREDAQTTLDRQEERMSTEYQNKRRDEPPARETGDAGTERETEKTTTETETEKTTEKPATDS